jgi:hypothetical protein
MSEFGFSSFTDYISSSFKWGLSVKPLFISITLGTVATYFEKFIGLEPVVYLSFISLLTVEFFTGIKASLKEGVKIESRKFGRIILKIMTYTAVIGMINIFRTRFASPVIFGMTINIYQWIFYTVLNLIVIQLIISIFENLSRLGYKESSRIFKFITKRVDKWFKMDEERGD